MTWFGNGRTYFFSGTKYWRYDNRNKRFDRNYPKEISVGWKGLPRTVDAAFSSDKAKNAKTFFISGGKYYIFNDK